MKEQNKYTIYKKGTYADRTSKYVITSTSEKTPVVTIKVDKMTYLFHQSRSLPDNTRAFLSEYVGWMGSKHGKEFAQLLLRELLTLDNSSGDAPLLPRSEAIQPSHPQKDKNDFRLGGNSFSLRKQSIQTTSQDEPTEKEVLKSLEENDGLLPSAEELKKLLLEDKEE